MKYKFRLFFGIFLALVVSISNGASLTSMIPIFDSLGAGENYKFQINISKKEKLMLSQSANEFQGIESLQFRLAKFKNSLNQQLSKMKPEEMVWKFCLLVFPIYLLKLFSLAGTIYFINSAGNLAVRDLRNELYCKLDTLPIQYFVRERTGELMSKVVNDVENLGKVISSDLKDAIVDFFYIITHLGLLIFLSWKLFITVFVVIPLVMGPISTFAEKIRKATKKQQDRLGALNGDLQEVVSGIRVIRAFSMEKKESERFFQVNHDLYRKTFKGHFYHQVGPSLVELAGALISIGFLSFGAYLLEDPNFSRGLFLTFFLTLVFLMRPLKQIGVLVNLIQAASSSCERVFKLLDEPEEEKRPTSAKKVPSLTQGIEFKNVSYRYPNSENFALQNLNFPIRPKESIAFVGSSGAGKSTLIDLLPRIIHPSSGSILWNGIDTMEFDASDLRKKFATVTQNIFLFNATIKENVSYGLFGISDSQIKEALEKAYAYEFILGFPDGWDTVVGERGVMLSGGQKQRISIARAFLRDPEVLLLDEATSALDTESERLISESLAQFHKQKTIIQIAHRLTTIQNVDTIYYMENGEILEMGSHAELMERDSKYKKLYELQFKD